MSLPAGPEQALRAAMSSMLSQDTDETA